jgi:hypothetical protein
MRALLHHPTDRLQARGKDTLDGRVLISGEHERSGHDQPPVIVGIDPAQKIVLVGIERIVILVHFCGQ